MGKLLIKLHFKLTLDDIWGLIDNWTMSRVPQNYGSISTPVAGFSGESSTAFNNYCDNVVTNIYTINSSLKTLDNALKTIGTSRDNPGLRNKMWVQRKKFKYLFYSLLQLLYYWWMLDICAGFYFLYEISISTQSIFCDGIND